MVIFVVCRTHFGCGGDNRLAGHRCDWQTLPSRPEQRRSTEMKGTQSGDISHEKGTPPAKPRPQWCTTQPHYSCSKHGQLPLLGKGHTHFPVLGPAPTRSILKPPSLPTPRSMHRKWGHSHSRRHTVTGPGSHKPGNSPKVPCRRRRGLKFRRGLNTPRLSS